MQTLAMSRFRGKVSSQSTTVRSRVRARAPWPPGTTTTSNASRGGRTFSTTSSAPPLAHTRGPLAPMISKLADGSKPIDAMRDKGSCTPTRSSNVMPSKATNAKRVSCTKSGAAATSSSRRTARIASRGMGP